MSGAADLDGLRVVVTAGAAGIGRETALAFREAGARVWICDIDEEAVAAFAGKAPDIGAVVADVAEVASVDAFFDRVLAEAGGLDVLVNNAGIAGPTGPVEEIEPEAWRACLAVNLDGTFLCLRRAVPAMKKEGSGCIVNLTSTAGIMGFPLRAPHASAKWAIVGLTKSLAMELGPHGIRVNAIAPGPVEGERMDRIVAAEARARAMPEDAVRAEHVRQTSLKAFIPPRDIADMIVYLASPAGARISGQVVAVDGHTETLGM